VINRRPRRDRIVMPISIFTSPQRLGTLPSNTPNLVTGERGEKKTSKRRASHRKQVFNKSKSCRTSSCWLAPRLRLAVFVGAFRRRKNLSVCVVRVLMPAKTPKGKLRFRRTKGEKIRTYSIHHRGSHYFSQNYIAQKRGIHSKKVRAAARS
jgi:hypothetical protein